MATPFKPSMLSIASQGLWPGGGVGNATGGLWLGVGEEFTPPVAEGGGGWVAAVVRRRRRGWLLKLNRKLTFLAACLVSGAVLLAALG